MFHIKVLSSPFLCCGTGILLQPQKEWNLGFPLLFIYFIDFISFFGSESSSHSINYNPWRGGAAAWSLCWEPSGRFGAGFALEFPSARALCWPGITDPREGILPDPGNDDKS